AIKAAKARSALVSASFTAASFADSSADAPASTIFTYSITRTRRVRLWLMGSIIDSTTWISLFTLSRELLLLMMRPTLVRVLAIKKKSSEKKTIRDDFFNDMNRYLKENYSLWLSAKPKLKLIKVID